jgi:putative endonuclease
MSTQRIELGKIGEKLALKHLKRHGYKILEQNYKSRYGEIDIIAKNKGVLAFIEVRTRKSMEFMRPEESVNIRKQRQITKVALDYLSTRNMQDTDCRFDVVAITFDDKKPKIELIKNAFYIYE